MKILDYGPLMALAVAIATLCILTDGVATLLVKRVSGSELNPIMNCSSEGSGCMVVFS